MFDKKRALEYILQVAQTKGISQAKLCENIYDYSHFNMIKRGITKSKSNGSGMRREIGIPH